MPGQLPGTLQVPPLGPLPSVAWALVLPPVWSASRLPADRGPQCPIGITPPFDGLSIAQSPEKVNTFFEKNFFIFFKKGLTSARPSAII